MTLLIALLMGVFAPDCEISIGDLKPFGRGKTHKVKIRESWQDITDTASIWLPRSARVRKDDQTLTDLNTIVKKGDTVTIKGGYRYHGGLKVQFQGFVREVKKNQPVEIECEDYMYLLKLDNHSIAWPNVDLETVIGEITSGANLKASGIDFETNIAGVDLGRFSMPNINGAQALRRLKDIYGIVSYFRIDPSGESSPTLVVGFPYLLESFEGPKIVRHGSNVINWNLAYRNADDLKIKIRAISNLKSGKKLIAEAGDPNGVVRTRNYPEVSQQALNQIAQDELDNIKVDGLQGTVTLFALPDIRHSQTVDIDDPIFTGERGIYYVDAREWTLNSRPNIRQVLTINRRQS